MSREKNVIEFYVLCNKLKNVIRTGWVDWNVKKDRIESVAEHIYGVEMLALAMYSEYKYEIDIKKVILMLAVHELEEIMIGDLTCFQISREEKAKIGHNAVEKVLKNLLIKNDIESLILEFDERKTEEAIFAYFCDKLECDIQCKIYDEEGMVDVFNQPNNTAINDDNVISLLKSGKTWSEMWLEFSQKRYNYDKNFKAISDYVYNNKIKE